MECVEQMCIGVTIRSKKIAIGTAYRPPWLSVQVFIDALSDSICPLSYNDHVILLGDSNINFLSPEVSSYSILNNFFNEFNLSQQVTEPTHFTSFSETLLDLICTDINLIRVWVDHTPTLSDHALVACESICLNLDFVQNTFTLDQLKT